MEMYSGYINKLIEELAALPGIGSKSAQRLAFHLINMPKDKVDRLATTIMEAKANVRYCKECYTLTDKEICPICANKNRNHAQIMVVENSRDLAAYEKTGKYEGVYHVLHGEYLRAASIACSISSLPSFLPRREWFPWKRCNCSHCPREYPYRGTCRKGCPLP